MPNPSSFGDGFAVVGVIHLLPLPGGPRESPGLDKVLARAVEDARALVSGGIEHAVIENFGDAPFSETVEPHVVAMMSVIGRAVMEATLGRLSLGVNVLRNDPRSALGVASAIGGRFVRVNVHVGASWTDQGLIQGSARHTLLYRRAIGHHSGSDRIAVLADVWVKHGSPAGESSLVSVAKDTALRADADVLILTGSHTGGRTDLEQVDRVRREVAPCAVWVGSGATPESLPAIAKVADGVIIGTALHRDSDLNEPLDPARVRAVIEAMDGLC